MQKVGKEGALKLKSRPPLSLSINVYIYIICIYFLNVYIRIYVALAALCALCAQHLTRGMIKESKSILHIVEYEWITTETAEFFQSFRYTKVHPRRSLEGVPNGWGSSNNAVKFLSEHVHITKNPN